MGSELLSSGERAFIVEGAAANVRSDGRSRLDYREFSLQTSVIPKVAIAPSTSAGVNGRLQMPRRK
jgi:exosome complex RNA-binding protein Rrp42 (RNase PH superfamily)